MLLDLSCWPILVISHEAIGHLVVRTMGTVQVNGLVSHQRRGDGLRDKAETKVIEPGVQLPRGRSVLIETKLDPVPNFNVALANLNHERLFGHSRPKAEVEVLPDPYEVATGYRDPLTGKFGTWRLTIQMQQRATGTWLATVSQYDGSPMMTVALQGLVGKSDPLGSKCQFPLSRFIDKLTQPDNAWDRLLGEDD